MGTTDDEGRAGRVLELDAAPGALSLYPRVAAGAVLGPLARALPPLRPLSRRLPAAGAAGARELPDLEVRQEGVRADADRVAAYDRLLRLRVRDALPATLPYVLAFPLQTRLMADQGFPLPVLGLVHVRNRIVQQRPLRLGEPFDLVVRAGDLGPHPRGTQLTVRATASVGDEVAWAAESTYLRIGRPPQDAPPEPGEPGASVPAPEDPTTVDGDAAAGSRPDPAAPRALADLPADAPAEALWRLGADFGRRYAAVSGDRNPIHLHPLTSRAFGMPRPIAHGMAVKARCLGALEAGLPDALELEVRFRRPVALPATVAFASERTPAGDVAFAVRGARSGEPHLAGVARPL